MDIIKSTEKLDQLVKAECARRRASYQQFLDKEKTELESAVEAIYFVLAEKIRKRQFAPASSSLAVPQVETSFRTHIDLTACQYGLTEKLIAHFQAEGVDALVMSIKNVTIMRCLPMRRHTYKIHVQVTDASCD